MATPRTIAPSLSSVAGKDLSAEVARSASYIGLAVRVSQARRAGTVAPLTKAECAFLRNYMAENRDPLAAIREAEAVLAPVAQQARTLGLAVAGPRVDVPRIGAGALGQDGRPMAVGLRKTMTQPERDAATVARGEHAEGAKALAHLDMLSMLRLAYDSARASNVAFAAVSPEKAIRAPGKRLEAHAAALLTADPTQVATLLKAMGLPAEAVGAILVAMRPKTEQIAHIG